MIPIYNETAHINKQDRQWMYKEHWGMYVQPLLQWKSGITYSECGFVALGIQHAMCMCHIVCSPSGSTIFFRISQMAQFLKKRYWPYWFSLHLLLEHFPFLRTGWHMNKNVYRSSRKVPVILVRFQRNFSFLKTVLKNIQIPNFMKIHPVEAKLFHADRQTHRWRGRHDKAKSHFLQFCEHT